MKTIYQLTEKQLDEYLNSLSESNLEMLSLMLEGTTMAGLKHILANKKYTVIRDDQIVDFTIADMPAGVDSPVKLMLAELELGNIPSDMLQQLKAIQLKDPKNPLSKEQTITNFLAAAPRLADILQKYVTRKVTTADIDAASTRVHPTASTRQDLYKAAAR